MSTLKRGPGRRAPEGAHSTDEAEQSAERFRKVFEYSNDAIFVLDPVSEAILDANPKALEMLGYSYEELLDVPISAIHPEEMPQLARFVDEVFRDGHGWTDELSCLARGGDRIPSEISASVVTLRGQRCVLSIVRDIRDRKQAEEALKQSEERLGRILESAMDAIVTFNDSTHEIRLFNTAAEKTLRCPAAEAIDGTIDRFLTQSTRALVAKAKSAFDQGDRTFLWVPEGTTARRADGEEFPIEATISRVEAAGELLCTLILRDVNERRRAEEAFRRLELERSYLQEELESAHDFGEIVGESEAVRALLGEVATVAPTEATVLILGETGTGKELVARAIHRLSPQAKKSLVTVNCAALPATLIESELFGHEKGAFTGALSRKLGRFELADGGTIFLDEIGDLPLELQAKLLRVLQDGEFERVGGSKTLRAQVRVIAATNRDLEEAMTAGLFRTDLFYRLNVFPLRLPPLRDRREDIPLLARHFVMKTSNKLGTRTPGVPRRTLDALVRYPWPGNVRELQNVMERGVIISRSESLEPGSWLPTVEAAGTRDPAGATLDEVQRRHILDTLEATGWRVSGEHGAAKILGLKPTTLEARMKKLGIERP